MTPYTCTRAEEVFDIELFNEDGEYVDVMRASECFASWFCENYGEMLIFSNATALTWSIRVPPPPVDEPETPAA